MAQEMSKSVSSAKNLKVQIQDFRWKHDFNMYRTFLT